MTARPHNGTKASATTVIPASVDNNRFQADVKPIITGKQSLVIWYGDQDPKPMPYLVEGIMPERQVAIVAGQHSAGKTFVADDLAIALMTGQPFAGHAVKRTGAVLWLAAEGAAEVDIRIKAAALHRTGRDCRGELPFCRQAGNVPKLTDAGAFDLLKAIIVETLDGLAIRHRSVPLVLIVIDTMNSAAGFQDQNAGGEAQRVMDLCRALSDFTGALVLAIDHFGKLAETGVKGSQNKSDSADTILALTCGKDKDGKPTDRRLRVHKQRSGPEGEIIPFRLVEISINDDGGTSCAVEWQPSTISEVIPAARVKSTWSSGGRVLKACIERMLADHGSLKRPFGAEGPEVRAVQIERVRAEFLISHHADSHDAKKKQWQRMLKEACGRELVMTRTLGASQPEDWLWFTNKV